MFESERLIDQYDRNLSGDAWHGDNVWKILGRLRPNRRFRRVSPKLIRFGSWWPT